MRSRTLSTVLSATSLFLGLTTGCSGGGGGGTGAFQAESVSVPEGAVWQLNRPIRVRFSKPVDFSSVNLGTFNVREIGGANALGELFLEDPQTVVFQPLCPTNEDASDAALQPGGVAYRLTLVGSDANGSVSIKSVGGAGLAQSVQRTFTTPTGSASELFFDPVVGAPRPRVRGRGGVGLTDLAATHVQLGDGADVAARLYYEDDGTGITLRDATGTEVELPLNLYSQTAQQVALLVYLDQPVSPTIEDPAAAAIFLEFEATPGNWVATPASIELLANCTSTGAIVRLDPAGPLPREAATRVNLTAALSDLTGEVLGVQVADFAVARTSSGPSAGALRDELRETFDLATFEDASALLAAPSASWEGGRLSPGFGFAGTGGLNGDFDVRINAGQTVIWNTSSQLVTGGPNFVPTATAAMTNGVFDVRNFVIEAGATLRMEGPNPVTILASEDVILDGVILVNGVNYLGVVQLNSPTVPEEGASGQCGGGQGGTGSPLGTASSPRGGTGFGPGNQAGLGGLGGEAGWAANNVAAANRRGSGGGGGRFGATQFTGTGFADESFIGLNAEPGFDGPVSLDAAGVLIGAFGAENPGNQEAPPNGGGIGASPFVDSDPTNDFFGRLVDSASGQVVSGELSAPVAGFGGGGGGDASGVPPGTLYPAAFDPLGDEKGGAGGGGAGAISIHALGIIRFGINGQLQCRGGHGGGGESTSGINRIGGGGGGGSGGHVILQSATRIDFSQKTQGVAGVPAILATGGQGGAGAGNLGGARQTGEVPVANDACHANSAPFDSDCQTGEVFGAGGDGGPGLIQLHTPLGNVGFNGDIVPPFGGAGLASTCFPTPLAPLVPDFGRRTRSRSVWIPLGEAGFNPADPSNPIRPTFLFDGTDPQTGSVVVNGQQVPALPELVPVQVLQAPGTGLPFIAADGVTLVMSDVGFPDELKANPELFVDYLIDLDPFSSSGSATARFAIAAAEHANGELSLSVPLAGVSLSSVAQAGSTEVRVRPTFFRVQAGAAQDVMPSNVDIRIFFEAAPADSSGAADLFNASGMLTDIAQLNGLAVNGEPYEFVRFEVLFDIDKDAIGFQVGQPTASLDFLKLPFEH